MDALEKLNWLIDKENGMGISQATLAKYCHCHPSTLSKYITHANEPTEKMLFIINEGIKQFYKDLSEKIGE